ncbi:unnamed protein product [Prunus armeniaca]|uniref:Uncharacterized protein n=1 Tax=Prunus armeniaca TaxID=36596 RepID=A0A6J5WQ29_PRUAR|nr:unnamed protein product [Prunus armeniaca]
MAQSSSPYMADKEPRVATNEGTVASMGRGGNPHHLKDEFRMTCAVADSSFIRQNVPRQIERQIVMARGLRRHR